jgi:hypothetical protein
MIRVQFRVFRNSYSPLTCSFSSLWRRIKFVVEVITIGGGLPDFLGVSCSGSVFSAPVVSVSMSVVLRGAKKLRVDTAFGGSLTAADVGTDLVDFLTVIFHGSYASCVSLLPGIRHPGPLVPMRFFCCNTVFCLCTHRLQFVQCSRVHAVKRAK